MLRQVGRGRGLADFKSKHLAAAGHRFSGNKVSLFFFKHGAFGAPFRILFGSFWHPLGSIWTSWGSLGTLWGSLGGLLGTFLALLGSFWWLKGSKGRFLSDFSSFLYSCRLLVQGNGQRKGKKEGNRKIKRKRAGKIKHKDNRERCGGSLSSVWQILFFETRFPFPC